MELRIGALEKELSELKERQPETHLHYHYPPAQYVYPKQTWWPYQSPWGTYTVSTSGGQTSGGNGIAHLSNTNGGN